MNFKKRHYLIEVELTDPENEEVYLLRYLTFNHLTQSIYPKVYITIIQHLVAKQRAIKMFDGNANEVLDFTKDDVRVVNKLFEKLVEKDISFPLVMKIKPTLECPKIKL